jgi:hypothetical protein
VFFITIEIDFVTGDFILLATNFVFVVGDFVLLIIDFGLSTGVEWLVGRWRMKQREQSDTK